MLQISLEGSEDQNYGSINLASDYVKHVYALERVRGRFLKHSFYREAEIYSGIGYSHVELLGRFSVKIPAE